MHNIDANTFLQTLFPDDLLRFDERPVIALPDSFRSPETGRMVEYYAQRHWHRRMVVPRDKATYFCLSTVENQRKRQVKKRLEDVRTAVCIVVDDVGTKSKPPPVPASWTLETSEGNFQLGWLIEPYDVSTPEGQAEFDAVLWSLAKAGMNDEGFRSASRLARLPGSLHRTGWLARVTDCQPHRVWQLEDLVKAFDIPMVKPRKSMALKPGKYERLEDVDDPVYEWLLQNWTIYGHNDQWVHIECPWRHTHTDGQQGPSSTSYSPMDYGRAGAAFKCMHGHCAGRGVDDFITEIMRRKNRE